MVGDLPGADRVGEIVGDAVAGLLADPVFSGVRFLLGALLPDFFGEPDVPAVLAGAAAQLAVAVVAGGDVSADARSSGDRAAGQRSDPERGRRHGDRHRREPARDEALWQLLGDTLSTVILSLAEDTDVQVFAAHAAGIVESMLAGNPVADQIGLLVGNAVAGLLADTRFSGPLASIIERTAAGLLRPARRAGRAGGHAGAFAVVIAGGDTAAVLAALRANVAIQGAVGVTVTDVVGSPAR